MLPQVSMRRIFYALFVAVSLSWIAYVRTDGFFSPEIIEGPLQGASRPVPEDIKALLMQPFHYIGKGRQCFVFGSEDEQYVLKFFNQRYLQTPWYASLTGEKEKAKRSKRRFFYEHSYEIAYQEFGEEILILHMGEAQDMPAVAIRDKASRKYILDLNRIPFVLQRKGTLFYKGLELVFEKEGMKGLCREIDQFLELVAHRISKRIADADIDVENNWGYLNGRLFHLDPGRLYLDPSLENQDRRKKEWHNATYRLHKWLKVHHPEAARYLTNQLSQAY